VPAPFKIVGNNKHLITLNLLCHFWVSGVPAGRFSNSDGFSSFPSSATGPICRWRMRFMSGMREIDVGSKGDRHFPEILGIWTKLCFAKGTFIVARKSPIAVFGCAKVRFFSHTQSLRRSLARC